MKARKDTFLAPDLTPLIDVVFLLLIFFVVTSVFKKEELSLLLSLPQSQSGAVIKEQKDIVLALNKESLQLNEQKVSWAALEQAASQWTAQQVIFFRIDKSVTYERIVQVLDLLKKYKIENISLETESR